MDGMALTLKQISTFHKNENLKGLLDDLVKKGYLRFEHPKKLVQRKLKTVRKNIVFMMKQNQKAITL